MKEQFKRFLYTSLTTLGLSLFALLVAWIAPSGTAFEGFWGLLSIAIFSAFCIISGIGIKFWIEDGFPEEEQRRRGRF